MDSVYIDGRSPRDPKWIRSAFFRDSRLGSMLPSYPLRYVSINARNISSSNGLRCCRGACSPLERGSPESILADGFKCGAARPIRL